MFAYLNSHCGKTVCAYKCLWIFKLLLIMYFKGLLPSSKALTKALKNVSQQQPNSGFQKSFPSYMHSYKVRFLILHCSLLGSSKFFNPSKHLLKGRKQQEEMHSESSGDTDILLLFYISKIRQMVWTYASDTIGIKKYPNSQKFRYKTMKKWKIDECSYFLIFKFTFTDFCHKCKNLLPGPSYRTSPSKLIYCYFLLWLVHIKAHTHIHTKQTNIHTCTQHFTDPGNFYISDFFIIRNKWCGILLIE